MWKDFFYYTKGERRAIVLLLALIVIALGGLTLSPYIIKENPQREETESFDEMDRFLASVHEMEQEKRGQYANIYVKKREVRLAPFDPNKADSIGFLQLGLQPFIAHRIIKYRKAGGKFSTPESFSRIYGLRQEQFDALKPYIYISEEFLKKPDTIRLAKKKTDTLAVYKYPEGTWVDLNRADTVELKKIPGIGSGIARMIVAYRQRLGGFYDINQLEEINYVSPELKKWFILGNTPIHRININTAGIDKLRSHPYMNFYKAKVIIEYRRKKGKIKSLSQLALYEEFTEKDLERLSPYFDFN